MIALVPLLCFAAFCLLWPVVASGRPRKIYPLSPDDMALWAHYLKADADKVKTLRRQSEAIRRHYEGITWPAIQWEVRKREIYRHLPTMREAV